MNTSASRIWLLLGDKLGDNAQVRSVSTRLGAGVVEKPLQFLKPFRRGKPPFLASLYHLDRATSAALEPPWPDLILTIGRRPAMAALWVRKQSGGRTRIALFGRPKRSTAEFDLVIVPSQYEVPEAPNVLQLRMPLLAADPTKVAAAAQQRQSSWSDWPRPLTAVFIGGRTAPFRLDAAFVDQLQSVLPEVGTTYITTSRRTGEAVVQRLKQTLRPSQQLYAFDVAGSDNPYLALLGSADRFVVTGDSVSMLVEVASLNKPLCIATLPRDETSWRRMSDGLGRWFGTGYGRELGRLHEVLVQDGRAGRLDWSTGRLNFQQSPLPFALEVERVVQRIQQLL